MAIAYRVQVVDIAGKGKGLLALEAIPRGARIISEEAIVVLNVRDMVQMDSVISLLPLATREEFMSFPMTPNSSDPVRSRAAHFLPLVEDGLQTPPRGLFPTICRVNHSCSPNAIYYWHPTLKKEGKLITLCLFHYFRLTIVSSLYSFTCTQRHPP